MVKVVREAFTESVHIALWVGGAVVLVICAICFRRWRRAIYTFVGSSGANGERKAALRGRERVSVVEDVDFANIHLELKDGRCAMVELSEAEVGSFDDLLEQLSEEFESSFAGKVTSPPLHDIRRDSHETMSGRCRFVPSRWIQHRSR